MKSEYYIQGMSCEACADKVSKALSSIMGVVSATADLVTDKVALQTTTDVSIEVMNEKLRKIGDYRISKSKVVSSLKKQSTIRKFAPLVVVFSLVILYTIIHQSLVGYGFHKAMADFMGAYFILFGSLKVFNLKGFVESYRRYDPLAKRSKTYAYLYPFIELGMGVAYLVYFHFVIIGIITAVIMGVKAYGVRKKLNEGGMVQCACLGGFFTIPLTRFTFFEDYLMAIMGLAMLLPVK